jgi:hypothetical protein
MKVLFLDIDGVLNSVNFSQKQVRRSLLADTSQIDPDACTKLQDLIKKVPDLKIVISSTWRKLFSISDLKQELKLKGIDPSVIIDYTPVIHNVIRGEEIKAWLNNNSVTTFAIVDDDADMGDLMPNLVQTDVQVGIQDKDILKIIKLLSATP